MARGLFDPEAVFEDFRADYLAAMQQRMKELGVLDGTKETQEHDGNGHADAG